MTLQCKCCSQMKQKGLQPSLIRMASTSAYKDNHPQFLNVGTGKDISIKDLAYLVADKIGYKGKILWDTSKPDGTPQKLLDISKLNNLGWKPLISLDDGIEQTIKFYIEDLKRKNLRN